MNGLTVAYINEAKAKAKMHLRDGDSYELLIHPVMSAKLRCKRWRLYMRAKRHRTNERWRQYVKERELKRKTKLG